jgi:hypothetical protein
MDKQLKDLIERQRPAHEAHLATALANLPTRHALDCVAKLQTDYGVDSAQSAEERFQARSSVLAALSRRRREIREGGTK